MSFYERLQKETTGERDALYRVPQIVDGMRGAISRENYIAYLAQAYHHVKHTLPLLMAAGSRIPAEKEWLRRVFAEYIGEETGHEEWILNDIRLAGGNAEAVRAGVPSLPVELMTAYAYDLVMRRNPIGFFGMVFVLEGTSTALATHAAEAIRQSLNLQKDCFSYLLSHGSLDVGHMQFFEKNMNRITDPIDQRDIIHTAKVIYHLFAEMFRSIPHESKKEAA
jgi:long-chain acyl-CoA synthetase